MTSYPQKRTDRNNNPAAFTTDIARQAGLKLGVDYVVGDQFPPPSNLFTARLLHDPVDLTIQVIDAIGYYTKVGGPRWTYISIPSELWRTLSYEQKVLAIKWHYQMEGGIELKGLFDK